MSRWPSTAAVRGRLATAAHQADTPVVATLVALRRCFLAAKLRLYWLQVAGPHVYVCQHAHIIGTKLSRSYCTALVRLMRGLLSFYCLEFRGGACMPPCSWWLAQSHNGLRKQRDQASSAAPPPRDACTHTRMHACMRPCVCWCICCGFITRLAGLSGWLFGPAC